MARAGKSDYGKGWGTKAYTEKGRKQYDIIFNKEKLKNKNKKN